MLAIGGSPLRPRRHAQTAQTSARMSARGPHRTFPQVQTSGAIVLATSCVFVAAQRRRALKIESTSIRLQA
jgi:hypothetical protein